MFLTGILFSPALVHADRPPACGSIRGTVLNRATGEPLDYTNVLVLGTTMGAMARNGGQFTIQLVPVGTYQVKASFVGYEPVTLAEIRVDADKQTVLEFRLKKLEAAGSVPAVQVIGVRPKVNVKDSSSEHVATDKDVLNLPVDSVIEAVALNPGVVVRNNELIIRGGRPGETSVRIDGMPADDPLSGGSVALGVLSVSQYQLITGGMDAEYGNANSGIINYTTPSGGRNFQGNFRYQTDRYGRADKTYTNFDRYSLGFGGPTPFKDLTFFVSGEATFLDGEHLSSKNYPEHEFLGIQWKERADTDVRTQARLDWRLSQGVKMSGELTLSQSEADPYLHNWTTVGQVSRVVVLPEVRSNRFKPGYFFIQGNVTMYDGPWREAARTANYVPIDEDANCTYCLMPVQENQSVRAVRVVDLNGRGDDPARPVYAYPDYVVFEGFQNPTSTWVPELEGAPGDSNKTYYNSAEHVGTRDNTSQQLKWTLTHTLSPKTFYEVKLSRLAFGAQTTVSGKAPEEFDTARKFLWVPGRGPQRIGTVDFYTDADVPYFATAYDRPVYNRRNTVTYLMRSDVTSQRWRGHRVKGGLLVQYNDLDNAQLTSPGLQRQFFDSYGLGRNVFHNFNPEGSFYVQDRWEYEGMVVNAGVRYDFFSPGSGVGVELNSDEIRRDVQRWQTQWSPRLGLAFPITDRDAFSFHYGRFIQFPEKSYIFASQDVNQPAGTLGNPNLEPETSISYQAGIHHQFTNNVSAQFALFNKDYYGLVSSIQITDDSTGTQSLRWVNQAFASSRGVELGLSRSFANNFAFDVHYTFSFADGVASDADFGRQAQGLSYIPTGELPLDWDQRHTLNTNVTVARSGDWSATVLYQYGSGFPWTPSFRFEKKQDPLLENSRRLPSTNIVNLRAEKFFRISGQTLRLFFDGHNLLNDHVVANPEGVGVFPGLQNAQEAYLPYATETGQFGGAYLKDTDGDGRDEFFPVHDPNVYGERRLFRIGLGFEF
jgi:outer membrane receptor protein involved in Fe transport